MSIHTISIDDFMRLDAKDHELALAHYDREIDTLATNLKGSDTNKERRDDQLDKLARLATLRKVHLNALNELKETQGDE